MSTIFHVAHFLSYHLRITDTVSYEIGNILVVAWLLLCATCAEGGGEGGGCGGGEGGDITSQLYQKSHVALRGQAKLSRCYQTV